MRFLFATGMQRSGTTLLDKLLSTPPRVTVLSQPLPLLFVELKRRFLDSLGFLDDPMPLGDRFRDRRYRAADFTRYLERTTLDSAALRRLFAEMETYSGQYTRFAPAAIERVLAEWGQPEVIPGLEGLLRGLTDRQPAWLGLKETLGEEFVPPLLGRGWSCAIVIRDPRDVLASLNFGSGRQHGGRPKPTLLNLRNWRKSVAFARALDGSRGFAWLRYEDLVGDPAATLENLHAALGLPHGPAPVSTGPLFDQTGEAWSGNSSHGELSGIDSRPVGSHRGRLSEATVRFVEAACYPELRSLGYPLSLSAAEVPEALASFRDPHGSDRVGLERYTSREALDEELERFSRLERDRPDTLEEASEWFLFPRVYDFLRAGVGAR